MHALQNISKLKVLFSLFVILGIIPLFVLFSSAQSNIVINEFELDPPGRDSDAGNEWVELYNPTTSSIDISNWKIIPTNNETNTVILPEGAIIRANGYYVANYSTQWLDNAAELIILQDTTGNEIDRTPSKNDAENDGRSWSRNPNGVDADNDNDWIFQESTKGLSNSGEEPTPSPTTEPSPTPESTSPSPAPTTTTTETTTSSEDIPVLVASASQTANYLPYITIPLATLAVISLASVYMFRIRPSKIQQNRHEQMIHEYELALDALDRMDIPAARKHVMAAKQLREGKT